MPDSFGHFLFNVADKLNVLRMSFVTNMVLFRTKDSKYCGIENIAFKFVSITNSNQIFLIMRNLYNLKYLALFFSFLIFVSCEEEEDSVTVEVNSIIPSTLNGRPNVTLGCIEIDQRDVTIQVWDHGIIDGDIVTIYANGSPILSNELLDGPDNPASVTYTFTNNGYNYLALEAQNEGDIPPNTCTVYVNGVPFILEANLDTNGAVNVVVTGYDVFCD